jgi:murein DD-endopeptidase MepM/ murein hydrolase activator NlpD
MRAHFACCCVLLGAWGTPPPQAVAAGTSPDRYILEYPAAERFCPPVAGFFDEVERTIERVGNRTFRHQPNGGFGLPVQGRAGDALLLHLGADVGWHRVGEPVFAVANGVVRVSQGPLKDEANKGRKPADAMAWGNLIVLEHRLPDGNYVTTVYGHLANERLVSAGDVVRAGQQIGTIGTTRVNGGYKPHLHFGVRQGRMAEVGRMLAVLSIEGKQVPLRIAELREDEIVLDGAEELPERMHLTIDDQTFEISRRGDKAEVAAAILAHVPSPEFAIIGYGLSAEGWHDPTAFLKEHRADIAPAAFEMAKPRRNREK